MIGNDESEISKSKTSTDTAEYLGSNTSDETNAKHIGLPRKKKSTHPSVLSTKLHNRRSTRLKKSPAFLNYKTEDKRITGWTVQEKYKLLEGLKAVGDNSVEELAVFVPSRNLANIHHEIKRWRDAAIYQVKRKLEARCETERKPSHLTNIGRWLEIMEEMNTVESPRLYALSKVFLLISEYGKFPLPEENNGVDLRAMYRYIHCMLNGLPFSGINVITARVIDQFLNDLSKMMWAQQIYRHLQSILVDSKPRPTHRTYSDRRLASTSNLSNLWTYKDTNPLNLPPTFLQKSHNKDDNE